MTAERECLWTVASLLCPVWTRCYNCLHDLRLTSISGKCFRGDVITNKMLISERKKLANGVRVCPCVTLTWLLGSRSGSTNGNEPDDDETLFSRMENEGQKDFVANVNQKGPQMSACAPSGWRRMLRVNQYSNCTVNAIPAPSSGALSPNVKP